MDASGDVAVKKKVVPSKKKAGSGSASEESAAPYPDMGLAQEMHRLKLNHLHNDDDDDNNNKNNADLQKSVFERIAVDLENPSLYRRLQADLETDNNNNNNNTTSMTFLSDAALRGLEAKHESALIDLEAKVEQAKETAGDMEVMDARMEIARLAAKSLSEAAALDAYDQVLALPKLSSGKKIDIIMERARVASFYSDVIKADECIEKAAKLADEGGGADWDRRNRLKIYRALQNLAHRDIQGASGLLLDCIATFSCTEICSYTDFIVYAILSNLLHLPRPGLKKQILDGPEILSVKMEIPVVINLVQSFYECDYKAYLHAMVDVERVLLEDRYLQPHAAYWMRELHILAYKQFLDSYQSVTLQAMADAFGVSTEFIDYHASRFIAANRLSAKIDKYGGVIVSNRPDLKNALYRDMIQKGDLLLNRVQKLARVVDL